MCIIVKLDNCVFSVFPLYWDKRSRLFVFLAAESGVGVCDLNGQLSCPLHNNLPVLGGHIVGNFGTIAPAKKTVKVTTSPDSCHCSLKQCQNAIKMKSNNAKTHSKWIKLAVRNLSKTPLFSERGPKQVLATCCRLSSTYWLWRELVVEWAFPLPHSLSKFNTWQNMTNSAGMILRDKHVASFCFWPNKNKLIILERVNLTPTQTVSNTI